MNPDISIATFEKIDPANALAQKLCDAGILATVEDETATQKHFLVQKEPHASVHVLVEEANAVRAEEIVMESAESSPDLVRCPQCHRSRITFPQFSRKYLPDTVLLSVATRVGLMKPQYFCENCSWIWSPDGSESAIPPTPIPPDPSE